MTIRIPKPDADWTVHFAAEEQRIRTEERERVLAIIEGLSERFEHVATFRDGTQERVIYSAAFEVELWRALRAE